MYGRFACALVGAALVGTLAGASLLDAQQSQAGDWRWYGGTAGGQKYSSLDQINAGNVRNLRIVWRQAAAPAEVRQGRPAPIGGNFQHTPLMVGGLLLMRSEAGPVTALDPTTGKVVWVDGKAASAPGSGRSRGIGYWTDGQDARVLALDGYYLVALNAKTGGRYPDFGDGGRVDLRVYADPRPNSPIGGYSWTSFPVVVGNIIVMAGVPSIDREKVPAGVTPALDAPGDIRGYDVRTGKLVWTFHSVPRAGEFGYDTWLNNSADINGGVGPWSWLTADEELGYVYLPMQASTNDFFGGLRPGNNLFANSVVCLDARTGKRVWHFQTIHHDIWDFDNPTGPVLVDMTVDGRRVKAVVQLTKQAYAYVLDRVTGQPIWPIEEKPMPKGDVPGEWYSPTQPIPTKPAGYELQNLTTDDLIDFTPELRAQAIEEMGKYKPVPVFTPASANHEIVMTPGTTGGSDWHGAGFDPETGMFYISATRNPVHTMMAKPANPGTPFAYNRKGEGSLLNTNLELPFMDADPTKALAPGAPSRLPMTKPPYGSIVAIDMNKGDIVWRVPNGDGPRNHPALKHLNLPPLGTPNRASPLVTKSLLFIGEGQRGPNGPPRIPVWGGGKMFRAFDKAKGTVVWEMELPGGTSGNPITYMVNGKQYIVVAVGWDDMSAELVALALP
ncbi:MAG: pyrroloquinoline quinone-dependent dehydrogenase [Gemmatimonadetes bacterium]|nr:pyrroloquinoline quinone-dependent dehydrogenase [Gemmatimonadota bacterium]